MPYQDYQITDNHYIRQLINLSVEDVENQVEDFYWDENYRELGMIVNDDVEVLISELEEMEQYEVAKLIIENAARNNNKQNKN